MRLFNYVIETDQVTNASATEVIGSTLSSDAVKPGTTVASMVLRDNTLAGSAQGGYNVYQTIKPKVDGASLLLSGSLSSVPDGITHPLPQDDSVTDVISIGQKNTFEG